MQAQRPSEGPSEGPSIAIREVFREALGDLNLTLSSGVIRGHQGSSGVIRGHQRSSDLNLTLSSGGFSMCFLLKMHSKFRPIENGCARVGRWSALNQMPSDAIRCHQMPSDATRGNQRQSEAITCASRSVVTRSPATKMQFSAKPG